MMAKLKSKKKGRSVSKAMRAERRERFAATVGFFSKERYDAAVVREGTKMWHDSQFTKLFRAWRDGHIQHGVHPVVRESFDLVFLKVGDYRHLRGWFMKMRSMSWDVFQPLYREWLTSQPKSSVLSQPVVLSDGAAGDEGEKGFDSWL